jgi:hypothetical protein
LNLCRVAGETSEWIVTGEGMNELAAGDLDAAATMLRASAKGSVDLPPLRVNQACPQAALGDDAQSRALERGAWNAFRSTRRRIVPSWRRCAATATRRLA